MIEIDNIEPASIKATEQDENVNIVGNKATEQDDGDNIEPASEQDENDDIQSKVKAATQQDGKAAKRRKLITGEAKLLNDSCDEKGSDENANSNTKNTESTDVAIFSDDDLDPSMFADSGVNNSLHLKTSDCSDDKIEPAGSDEGSELEVDSDAGSVLEADSSEEEADGDPGSNLDEASDEESENDKLLSMESHVSKCKVDYRLQTLQDLGRYQKNNPGAYYDHYENSWFCATCINFGGIRKTGTAWVDKGVKLGENPARAFQRHFLSDFHLQNLNFKKLFGSIRSDQKPNHIVEMLTSYKVLNNENQKKENREVVKILIKTAHYQIKHMMSNMSYPSLVKLISDCGSEFLKKFMIKSPKNASYLSLRTFDNLLHVLNSFTEEPLLLSLRKSKFVTIFHDETTDVSGCSE